MREMTENERDETRQFGVQEVRFRSLYVSSSKVSAIENYFSY